VEIKFCGNDTENKKIKYVVIPCQYKDKWVFVKHKQRDTWEFPAGHIEAGETSELAAKRELCEETGALDFSMTPISVYSVEKDGKLEYGHLFYAEILNISSLLQYEISEISFHISLPKNLTYPIIQPILFDKIIESMKMEI
jgi:8-oxo-dGTP diphosphatase